MGKDRFTTSFTNRSQRPGVVKAEVYVGKATFHGKVRWRWDITFLEVAAVDTSQPALLGVMGRKHLGGECGYTKTFLGAWWEIAKCFHNYPRPVV